MDPMGNALYSKKKRGIPRRDDLGEDDQNLFFFFVCVCVDHLKRCKTCNTSWAGPLPIPFTIPLVWYCCVTKLGRTLTQFVNHSSGLVLLLNQKMGRTLTHFVNHSSGLVYLKNRGGLEGHHVARANEALCDEPGKRTRRVVLGVIVDQLANPLNVLQPFLWSG